MNKSELIYIILGIAIIATIIIMIIHLGDVAYEHSIHPEWSLGVSYAVQITATLYGIVIGVFSSILVVLNVFRKSK